MGYGCAEERWFLEYSASASQPSAISSQDASAVPEPQYYLGYFPSEYQFSFYPEAKDKPISTPFGAGRMAGRPRNSLSEGEYQASSSGGYSDETTQERPASYSVIASTHDTGRAKYHLKQLGTFAQRVEEAALRAFPNRGRSRYKQVTAVLIQWEDDKSTAQPEIDRMRTILEACYGFYTQLWRIPSTSSHLRLMSMALRFVEDYGSADNLMVVYYGGRAVVNNAGQSTWIYGQDHYAPSVTWSSIQSLFEESRSDVLFLLDCCATPGSSTGRSQGVIETIAACGSESWDEGPGGNLFTNALISVLEDWVTRPSFTVAMLHSEVLAAIKTEQPTRRKWANLQEVGVRKTPCYLLNSTDPKALSIELAARQTVSGRVNANFSRPGGVLSPSNPSPVFSKFDIYNPANLLKTLQNGRLQIPHVLITVALEEHPSSEFEAWYRWIRQVPGLANYAVVEGIYRSHSTMLLVSIPVLIWDMLPDDLAVCFVGYVQSRNLLAAGSVEDFQHLTSVRGTSTRPIPERKSSKTFSRPSHIFTEKHVGGLMRGIQSPEPALRSATLIKITTLSPEKTSNDPKGLSRASSESNRRSSKMENQAPFDILATDKSTSHYIHIAKDLEPSRRIAKADDQVEPEDEIFGPGKLIRDLVREAKFARQEATRAWEELGKREKEEREKLSKLREGKSVFIGPFQVNAVDKQAAPPDMSAKAAAILGTMWNPPREATQKQKHKRSSSEPRSVRVENNKWMPFVDPKSNMLYGTPPPLPKLGPVAGVSSGQPPASRDTEPEMLRTMMSLGPSEDTASKDGVRSPRSPTRPDVDTAFTFLDDDDMHDVGRGLSHGDASEADGAMPWRKSSKLVKKQRDASKERMKKSPEGRLGMEFPILRFTA